MLVGFGVFVGCGVVGRGDFGIGGDEFGGR